MGVFFYLRRGGINSVIVGILGANSPTIYIIGITAFLLFIFLFSKKNYDQSCFDKARSDGIGAEFHV